MAAGGRFTSTGVTVGTTVGLVVVVDVFDAILGLGAVFAGVVNEDGVGFCVELGACFPLTAPKAGLAVPGAGGFDRD